MKTITKLVIAILIVQAAWFLLPQLEWRWMSQDEIVLAGYSGLGTLLDTGAWFPWTMLAVSAILTGGLVFFGTKWRIAFLGYMALMHLVVVPLSGMNVETGISMALRDLLSILIGALIALILLEEYRQ